MAIKVAICGYGRKPTFPKMLFGDTNGISFPETYANTTSTIISKQERRNHHETSIPKENHSMA